MTREEAIEWIKEHHDTRMDNCKDSEAMRMAIQALSQEPCDDAISRDEAITSIRRAFSWVVPSNPSKEVREIFNKCNENLRELPSVTPIYEEREKESVYDMLCRMM